MADIERIVGTETGKSAFEKTDRNVVKLDGDIDDLAGTGRTTETVKGNKDDLVAHKAEKATQANLGHVKLPPDSQILNLINGWTNSSYPLSVYKDDFGRVHLSGSCSDGVSTNGTALAILPSEFRPLKNIYAVCIKANNQSRFNIIINRSSSEIRIYGIDSTGVIELNISYEGER